MSYNITSAAHMSSSEFYFITPKEIITAKIDLLNLDDVFCDLGCGDARQLIEVCYKSEISEISGFLFT